VHTFEVGVFNPLDINKFTFAPESDLRNFDGGGVDPQIDCFSWGRMVYLQLEVVNGDSSVRVNRSVHSETEDIFHRLERGSDCKFSKGRLPLF
jgi:hypothetical protein